MFYSLHFENLTIIARIKLGNGVFLPRKQSIFSDLIPQFSGKQWI